MLLIPHRNDGGRLRQGDEPIVELGLPIRVSSRLFPEMKSTVRMALLAFVLLTTVVVSGPSFAQKASVVYVAPIEGMIDLGLAPFVDRVLREATEAGAEAVILEINTFGGRVDAAVLIRDALLNAK